jgi:hypothetical protein
MQPRNRLTFYEETLICLWQRWVARLGAHTARVLLHRAHRQATHVCECTSVSDRSASSMVYHA